VELLILYHMKYSRYQSWSQKIPTGPDLGKVSDISPCIGILIITDRDYSVHVIHQWRMF